MDRLTRHLTPAPARATTARPLLGNTVLVVEDSRFACEALRLMCLRSGARIRRADCLASARRHLKVYLPTVVLVDMGLPDGLGETLIEELSHAPTRIPALVGMSGDEGAEARARAAGADGFLAKPLKSLAAFQKAILDVLPPVSPSVMIVDHGQPAPSPDPSAFHDDVSHVATMLRTHQDEPTLDYVAQFLRGVARAAHDLPLERAVSELSNCKNAAPRKREKTLARLMQLLQKRLDDCATI